MSHSTRRSKKEIEDSAIAALERLVPELGFNNISLLTLVREAGMDHNVFYRNFGTIDSLYELFIKRYDFWLSNRIDVNQIHTLGIRVFMTRLFQNFYTELEDAEVMQKLLLWELENISPITRQSANMRERSSMGITLLSEEMFKDSKLDISSINAFLVSGIYYMVLHRKVSTVCGIDFNTDNGRKRALKTIEDLVNLICDKLEEQKKQDAMIKMMLDDGIERTKIAKYLNISQLQLKKALSKME